MNDSMTPDEIGTAIRAFRSDNCPACGAGKRIIRDPFCGDCFVQLPVELQEDVSDDSLFLDAFHPALSYLYANKKPGVPEAPPPEKND